MKKRSLRLDPEQRRDLEQMRDHDPAPYKRERAAALLKIADGQSAHAVAASGLLKRRQAETLYKWLNAYQALGVEGLVQKPRRRRDFSP